MLALVRLVLADDWHAVDSARRLRDHVADPAVLRHMWRRVQSAGAERPSWITSRAALTLEQAIAEPPPA